MKQLTWVLWPSFVVAGVAEVLFFTLIDPQQLYLFGEPVDWSRMTIYSLGFFALWATCAGSSMLTCFIQRDAAEVNSCLVAAACKDRVALRR